LLNKCVPKPSSLFHAFKQEMQNGNSPIQRNGVVITASAL